MRGRKYDSWVAPHDVAKGREGHLTRLGLLYEGNFGEWKERMKEMCDVQGSIEVSEDTGEEFLLDNDPSEETDLAEHETTVKDITVNLVSFIRLHVSPHLLMRVPPTPRALDGESARELLMKNLEKVAQPFRLMQLPDHLLVWICSFIIPESDQRGFLHPEHAKKSFRPPKFDYDSLRLFTFSEKVHPIAQTNSQLRALTLPMALRELTVNLSEYTGVKDFLYDFRTTDLCHLRKVALHLDVKLKDHAERRITERATFVVRLLLSKHFGLMHSVESHDQIFKLTSNSKGRLYSHMRDIFTAARTCGLQGQALLMALSCRPSLWESGGLYCERIPDAIAEK